MNKIFEPKPPICVKDLSELNTDELLKETFTITPIQTELRNKDGALISVSFDCYIHLSFLLNFLNNARTYV